ncbi:FAD-dependent oxidoreductase [Marinilactibacillus psychrotolerans]|uniref:FAD-dependent oxidoreductase n=1 Tax=Marinilactibacillus psychrotolerans TaxID=191770 RepID=UPI0039AF82BC
MNLTFLKGHFNQNLARVQSVENPKDRYYIINMTLPEALDWEAGDYALFSFFDQNNKQFLKFHPFYFASIPKEQKLVVGLKTKNPPNLFEEKVLSMNSEDRVKIKGPYNSHIIKETNTQPLVLIANGINIIPIRAFLKNLKSDSLQPVTLIYISRDFYLFREELDSIAKRNHSIKIHYVFDHSESSKILKQLVQKYGNNAFYYIYGSDKTISYANQDLKQLSIHKKQIITNQLKRY